MVRALLFLTLFGCAPRGAPAPAAEESVDIGKMWDFQDPAASEHRFAEAIEDSAGELRLELMTQLARSQGLQRRFDAANATLDDVEGALSPEMARARMRFLLERGRVLNTSGSPDLARPVFEEAWAHGRAHGLDALAIDAAHMVAIVTAGDEAVAWNERALELAGTSDDPAAARWYGSLLNNLGWAHFDAGRVERALELWQTCAAWHAERSTGRPERIARWTVGRALRELGRLDEALALQQEVLADWEVAGEQNGYVHEELGELLLRLGRPDEARPHLERAYTLLSEETWMAEEEPERLERLRELAGE